MLIIKITPENPHNKLSYYYGGCLFMNVLFHYIGDNRLV